MIYPYSHALLNRWNRSEVQVQIDVPGRQLPMGYCDGTDDDEAELRAIGEEEGLDELPIHKRVLKTGRQIWTVGAAREEEALDDESEPPTIAPVE